MEKKNYFFELPYWEHHLLRHNLDVMHIEKNVCENIVGTVLNVDGKSKDNLQSRLDLVQMGIRPDLHPNPLPNGKYRLPPSIFFNVQDGERTVLHGVEGYKGSRCVCIKYISMC